MIDQILRDSTKNPSAFAWDGPVPSEVVDAWEKECGLRVPEDLRELWSLYGGGELFETETLLGPVPNMFGEDIKSITASHRSSGLPEGLYLFHYGLGLGAVRAADGKIVVLDHKYSVVEQFDSVGKWYSGYLRKEYADHYGLGPEGRNPEK